jgi:hypothetical protein
VIALIALETIDDTSLAIEVRPLRATCCSMLKRQRRLSSITAEAIAPSLAEKAP